MGAVFGSLEADRNKAGAGARQRTGIPEAAPNKAALDTQRVGFPGVAPGLAAAVARQRVSIPEADPGKADPGKAASFARQGVGVPETCPSKAAPATSRSNLTLWSNALYLFLGDTMAFASAVAVGGIVAYAVNAYLLATPYLAFEEPCLIQQFIVVACVAAGICAWFARAGHYTERRPFRTD